MTYEIGDRVRLTKDIWDSGEDHHPPCYLAMKGEVLIVREIGTISSIGISHYGRNDNFFWVAKDEIEREFRKA